jgi:hypothetical protein
MTAGASTGRWMNSPSIRLWEMSCHCETIPPNSASGSGTIASSSISRVMSG